MKEYKELYLPLFYNWVEFTEELSDEEFGILIRALLLNARENAVPENLDAKINNLKISFNKFYQQSLILFLRMF
jgi:hypothetical protein